MKPASQPASQEEQNKKVAPAKGGGDDNEENAMPTGNNKHFPGKCPTPTSAEEQIDSLITHNRGRPGAFRHSQVSQSGGD